jgi:ankyrin repeat protein
MSAGVEDRGIKGDCTPLMEAASAGHADIVRLLIDNGADVNAQSSTGENIVFSQHEFPNIIAVLYIFYLSSLIS